MDERECGSSLELSLLLLKGYLPGLGAGMCRDSAASLTASSPYPISFGACCFVPGKPGSSLFVV